MEPKKTMIRIFITYVKIKLSTGEKDYGRTSGEIPEINQTNLIKILLKRDKSHQKNKEQFEKAELENFSPDYDAIRGREDMLIEKAKAEGMSANKYRGISPTNKKREQYRNAAIIAFGAFSVGLLIYFTDLI